MPHLLAGSYLPLSESVRWGNACLFKRLAFGQDPAGSGLPSNSPTLRKMKMIRLTLLTLVMAFAMTVPADAHECSLDFKAENIDGETVDLHDYEGKVVLIVNVASKCGYTKQYAGLQSLFEKYKDQGLVVLGFPCNQFGKQEPGSNADVKEFCSSKFGVEFPMMGKVEVNGDGACDLYKHLTSQKSDTVSAGPIKWNFEKFLIGRDGELVDRYPSKVAPMSDELTAEIEKLLAAKK